MPVWVIFCNILVILIYTRSLVNQKIYLSLSVIPLSSTWTCTTEYAFEQKNKTIEKEKGETEWSIKMTEETAINQTLSENLHSPRMDRDTMENNWNA